MMNLRAMMMSGGDGERAAGRRWMVLLLGGLTLFVFGGGGVLLITVVQERELWAVITGGRPWWLHVALGIAAGLVIGLSARTLVRSPWMRELDERFARRIGDRIAHPVDRVFLSLCAGVGEELFFRGALQHWLGLLPTAVVFVAVHGYLDPRDRRLFVYGLLLTAAMAGLGWMARTFGLAAPMLAHALIDVVLFEQLWRTYRRSMEGDQRPGYL
ncbi:MAG: CPBP family intramembrane metalloprotease [Flavobacteriales bacterium]|nr:CPBP family intramembrane metalloprotease [Flavobacteriales bacterium]